MGLYVKALENGLAAIPDIEPETTRYVNEMDEKALRREAARIDPDAFSKISPSDRQRLLRLVCVYRQTGWPLSRFQRHTKRPFDMDRARAVILNPDRSDLYKKINARVDQMIEQGVLNEVDLLAKRQLSSTLPAMKSVGLRPFLDCARNKVSRPEAIALAKRDTRRYAKRQFTWFSNQHRAWPRIDSLCNDSQLNELMAIFSSMSH